MNRLAKMVVGLALTSCSWLVVTPSPATPSTYPNCTESRGAPVLDAAVALTSGVLGVGGIVALNGDSGQGDNVSGKLIGVAVLVGLVAVAVPFAFSTHYGFTRTKACRTAHRDFEIAHPFVDPSPGLDRHACRPPGTVGGRCDAGLRCVDGACQPGSEPEAPPPPIADFGACRPIPGVAKGGTCDSGQVCRSGRCVAR